MEQLSSLKEENTTLRRKCAFLEDTKCILKVRQGLLYAPKWVRWTNWPPCRTFQGCSLAIMLQAQNDMLLFRKDLARSFKNAQANKKPVRTRSKRLQKGHGNRPALDLRSMSIIERRWVTRFWLRLTFAVHPDALKLQAGFLPHLLLLLCVRATLLNSFEERSFQLPVRTANFWPSVVWSLETQTMLVKPPEESWLWPISQKNKNSKRCPICRRYHPTEEAIALSTAQASTGLVPGSWASAASRSGRSTSTTAPWTSTSTSTRNTVSERWKTETPQSPTIWRKKRLACCSIWLSTGKSGLRDKTKLETVFSRSTITSKWNRVKKVFSGQKPETSPKLESAAVTAEQLVRANTVRYHSQNIFQEQFL